ncbi:MAG: diaminobutyrate--2-oxoglutarate transaminase [Myxococcota bacterium]
MSGTLERELHLRYDALGQPYAFKENELLLRQQQRESNARSYPRRIPIALRRAKGIYVEDVEGRVFMDCLAGAGALVLGHNHPAVLEAMQKAMREGLPLQTLDLTTPVKDQFVHDLFELLPQEFAARAKIQFCGPTGSDAVEAALKLVKTATERTTILAFQGAYHGMTQGSLALMGNLGPKRRVGQLAAGVQFLPYPYDYRCPFGLGGSAGHSAGIEYIRSVLSDPESGVLPPAGVILEVIQGEGGVIPAPDAWLRELRALTRAAGVPLIFDEVQTGLGRTGRLFAFEHAGVIPDVLVLSKAIGGGLPMSVVVYNEDLDTWSPGAHAGTFRGNQLAMAAGSAAMRFVLSERLDQHAERMGERLRKHLVELKSRCPNIGDVRGRGLMLGVEIVDPSGPFDAAGRPPAHSKLASAIQNACLRRGLIVEVGGRHGSVMRFLPPLIITDAQIDRVAEVFAAGLRAALTEQ